MWLRRCAWPAGTRQVCLAFRVASLPLPLHRRPEPASRHSKDRAEAVMLAAATVVMEVRVSVANAATETGDRETLAMETAS